MYKDGAKTVEMRTQSRAPLHITCARYGTAPNLGERPCSGKQRRCPLRPKVRPDERPCNNQNASQRQMAVPTDEEDRRREPMTGANAKSRVGYGGENHCASPTTSGAFTLPKQCNRTPTMKRSGQLGCRASEPARQPPRLKGLTRDPMFGKFSDASQEDRLEADLPEVNLPPRCRLRGGAGETMNK